MECAPASVAEQGKSHHEMSCQTSIRMVFHNWETAQHTCFATARHYADGWRDVCEGMVCEDGRRQTGKEEFSDMLSLSGPSETPVSVCHPVWAWCKVQLSTHEVDGNLYEERRLRVEWGF